MNPDAGAGVSPPETSFIHDLSLCIELKCQVGAGIVSPLRVGWCVLCLCGARVVCLSLVGSHFVACVVQSINQYLFLETTPKDFLIKEGTQCQ